MRKIGRVSVPVAEDVRRPAQGREVGQVDGIGAPLSPAAPPRVEHETAQSLRQHRDEEQKVPRPHVTHRFPRIGRQTQPRASPPKVQVGAPRILDQDPPIGR